MKALCWREAALARKRGPVSGRVRGRGAGTSWAARGLLGRKGKGCGLRQEGEEGRPGWVLGFSLFPSLFLFSYSKHYSN